MIRYTIRWIIRNSHAAAAANLHLNDIVIQCNRQIIFILLLYFPAAASIHMSKN